MLTLRKYSLLATAAHSYRKVAKRTGFTSRELWNMGCGGLPRRPRDSSGNEVPRGEDGRYIKLGKLVPDIGDPHEVLQAALLCEMERTLSTLARG